MNLLADFVIASWGLTFYTAIKDKDKKGDTTFGIMALLSSILLALLTIFT